MQVLAPNSLDPELSVTNGNAEARVLYVAAIQATQKVVIGERKAVKEISSYTIERGLIKSIPLASYH